MVRSRSGLWGKSGMTRCPARLVVFRLSPKVKVQELVHWGKDQACGPSTGLCGWQCPYRHRPGVLAQSLGCEPVCWRARRGLAEQSQN